MLKTQEKNILFYAQIEDNLVNNCLYEAGLYIAKINTLPIEI